MSELSASDLQNILQFTIQIARQAGDLILEGSKEIQKAGSLVDEKLNAVDLVTKYDVAVEELVKKKIAEKYPHFKFVGEESYSKGVREPLTEEPTYCVDPIDGTTNFVHGFPYACISLGLIYKRRPVLGVIYNPFLDHLYSGLKDHGSYLTKGLNSEPIKLPLALPRPLPSLQKALIGVEWGSDRRNRTIEAKAGSFSRLAGDVAGGVVGGKNAHSLRSLGSAAINYAMVAQGGLDLYWEIGCWPWDVCAGIVIAEEAGGLVTGSKSAFSATADGEGFGDVTEDILTGRKYIVIRAIADTPGETGRQAQRRIVKEFYETVEEVEPL
ncbi:inositol monophosphatase [Macrolepiota fuliginosa MF-IS2]|uniref:Inositol-1-monophosphatase n=1 Tax=Macrolepiota fuliginosa MF-IS2 TaxID=1400762 RepID=A0A9P6BXV2_9AGAR|nr:inositol monophosphatase [Macrolepiota fuliginosa MF-IS2]